MEHTPSYISERDLALFTIEELEQWIVEVEIDIEFVITAGNRNSHEHEQLEYNLEALNEHLDRRIILLNG